MMEVETEGGADM